MATTTALCTSFKSEILTKTHGLTADTIKAALIKASPTGIYGAASTNYSNITGNSDEVSGTGYTAGGATLSGGAVTTSGTTAFADWSDVSCALFALLDVQGIAAIGALVADTAQRIAIGGVQGTTASASMIAAVKLLLSGGNLAGLSGQLAEEIAVALIAVAKEAEIGEFAISDGWLRLGAVGGLWNKEVFDPGAWNDVPSSSAHWIR